jgi:hypothetical protein
MQQNIKIILINYNALYELEIYRELLCGLPRTKWHGKIDILVIGLYLYYSIWYSSWLQVNTSTYIYNSIILIQHKKYINYNWEL